MTDPSASHVSNPFPGGVTAVIVCTDDGQTVTMAVDAVRAQTRAVREILIIDQDSTDPLTLHTLARLAAPGLRVVRANRRGAAACLNLGITLAHSRFCWVLDTRLLPTSTFLEQAAAAADGDRTALFVCGTAASDIASVPGGELRSLLTRFPLDLSIVLSSDLWEAVSGFDARTGPYEQQDAVICALAQGFTGRFVDGVLTRQVPARRPPGASPHLTAVEAILTKHRSLVERLGTALLVEKERAIQETAARQRSLYARRTDLEQELTRTQARRDRLHEQLPQAGENALDYGELRRLTPLSLVAGVDRGLPVHDGFVRAFLETHRSDIRGDVLEARELRYTRTLGGEQVISAHTIDFDSIDSAAEDPSCGPVADGSCDCLILADTLHKVYDCRAAVRVAHRLLKPNGVLLCTVPSITPIDVQRDGLRRPDYWRFTEASLLRMFSEVFPYDAVDLTTHGNVFASVASLHGIAAHELSADEIGTVDGHFPVTFAVRAVKPARASRAPHTPGPRSPGRRDGYGTILMYHRVADLPGEPQGLTLHPAAFRAQMKFLVDRYVPVSLHTLTGREGRSCPLGAVAVTFDDGYIDALTTVSPILQELGIPATFFVNGDRWGPCQEFWWDTLRRIFNAPELPALFEIVIDGESLTLETESPHERQAAHDLLRTRLYRATQEARLELVRQLVSWSGIDNQPRETHRAMTGPELVLLAARPGHRVGGHTVNHLCLPAQPREVQLQEVSANKRALETLLDTAIVDFSYPYGEFDEAVVDVISEAGFSSAVTVEGGLVRHGLDPLRLPRLEVATNDLRVFALRLGSVLAPARE